MSGNLRPQRDTGPANLPPGKLHLMAAKNPLVGTWKLKSYIVIKATGELVTPYGDSPMGYLTYTPNGRVQVIGVANGRRMPAGTSPPDNERVALYDTMFAYAGTFSIEGDKVIHQVDVSWNEAWTGTDQIRTFAMSGDVLTITARIRDPESGGENHYALAWEKVPGPC